MTTTAVPTESGQAPWLDGIEGSDAHELIESNSDVIRVVAGPGSGKTTCLKRRVQRLVQKDDIDPKTMFVGTFTRAIASEIRDALGTQVRVSTLHSLAFDLLRKHPAACQGMKLHFLLKFEEDVLLYDIEDVASDIGNIHKRREALRLLQASRSQRIEYSNARFAGAVRQWLLRHRGMLIGEVVYLCTVGLESSDIPAGEFDYVVIDEYQDLTAAEQELVRFIWSENGAITVMGDNDQSIYGFRFNHPEGIAEFHRTWSECKDLVFIDNRRNGKRILKIANLMMAEAGSTKPPMTWKSARAGELMVTQWETLDDEIAGLAEYIRSRGSQSFLVLVPRRFIGYRLADAIGDDAKTTFSEQVLEHPIAQEAFSAASVLANPLDFVAARAYLGFHGTKRVQAERRNADAYSRLSLDNGGHELLRQIANGEIRISGAGQSHIKARAKKAIELIERSLPASEVVDLLFDDSRAEEESDDEKRRWLIESLQELRTAAHEQLGLRPHSDLSRAISALRYRIATRAPLKNSDDYDPRVRIMTLHSAKGLESDNVVVAGVADQFMPGEEIDLHVIAEQRRLLYVAVTRARDSLIISWPRRISAADVIKNMGRIDRIITHGGVRRAITSRSSLLPQGLSGVISGDQFLSQFRAKP